MKLSKIFGRAPSAPAVTPPQDTLQRPRSKTSGPFGGTGSGVLGGLSKRQAEPNGDSIASRTLAARLPVSSEQHLGEKNVSGKKDASTLSEKGASRFAAKTSRLVGKASHAIRDIGRSFNQSNYAPNYEDQGFTEAEIAEARYYGLNPSKFEPERGAAQSPHERFRAGSGQSSPAQSPMASPTRTRRMTAAEQEIETARAGYYHEEPNHLVTEPDPSAAAMASRTAATLRPMQKPEPEIWRPMNHAEREAEDQRAAYHNERPHYSMILDRDAMAARAQQKQKKLQARSQESREELPTPLRQEPQKATPQRASNARSDVPKVSNQSTRRPASNHATEGHGTSPSMPSNTARDTTKIDTLRRVVKEANELVEMAVRDYQALEKKHNAAPTSAERSRLRGEMGKVLSKGEEAKSIRDEAKRGLANLPV